MPEAKKRKKGRTQGGSVGGGMGTSQGSGGKGWIRQRTWKKIKRWGFIGAAGLIGVLVILSFALQSFPGAGTNVNRVEETGEPIRDTGRAVHQPERRPIIYDTIPPDSGDHWPRPASCGLYDDEINDEFVVHNMEHGHVVISYNLSDAAEIQGVADLADDLFDFNSWGIIRPYSDIPEGQVSLTVWGKTELVQGEDLGGITAFYEENRANRFSAETASVGAIPCTSSVHRG